jgi:hypothetical protein
MTTLTATYKRTRIPTTTVSYNSRTREYKAVVNVTGLAPVRVTSGEESLQGIVSLDPPTVVSEQVNALIDLAIIAVSNSADATASFKLTPERVASISYSVSAGIRGALELIELQELS